MRRVVLLSRTVTLYEAVEVVADSDTEAIVEAKEWARENPPRRLRWAEEPEQIMALNVEEL